MRAVALAGFVTLFAACDAKRSEGEEVPAAEIPAKQPADPDAVNAPVACGDDCMAVPEGIRSLAFGMSRDRVGRELGRLRKRRVKRRRVGDRDCTERLSLPGQRYIANTEIGPEKASCELWFLEADEAPDGAAGLAVIDCALDGRRKKDEHVETVWLLYQSLAKQYGNAPALTDQLVRRGRLRAMWKDTRAELLLNAFHRGRRSEIELINRSPRYAAALDKQEQAVKARCDAEAAARARKQAERDAQRRQRARDFERDLRPPLERPK